MPSATATPAPGSLPQQWLSSSSTPALHASMSEPPARHSYRYLACRSRGAAWDPGRRGLQYRWVGWERAGCCTLEDRQGRSIISLRPDFPFHILRLRTRALERLTREIRMGQTSLLRALPVSSPTFTLSFLSLQDLSWLVRARTPTPDSLGALLLYTQASLIRGFGGQSYPPQFNPSSPSAFS